MNTISKKLLSMLVVAAMVLSMVPTVGLPAFAVEETPTDSEVTPGQANLPDGIQAIIDKGNAIQAAAATALANNYCPVCEETVTWTAVTNKITDSAATEAAGTNLHYVISGDLTNASYNFNALTGSNITLCLLLNDANVTLNGRFRIAGTDNTLNVMGTGSITSDGSKCEDLGLFTMNGTNPTVNLYGGSYTYTGNSVGTGTAPVRALINAVDAKTPTVNLYADATIGKAAVDTSVASYNVYVAAGTVNMYGGTIRNGVTGVYGYSGNVGVAGGTTFNLYGGTVMGGQYLSGTGLTSPASVGGNILVGCYTKSGDKYTNAAATLNMYGGTVTGGKAYNGGNGGGNICTLNSGTVMNLQGGTISDGWARAYGGNVQHQNGTATIGGTVLITNGYAQNNGGGNLEVSAGKTLTMTGGFITGGDKAAEDTGNAKNGGAVYVRGTFEMTGGEIDGCTVSGNGGNIYAIGGTVNVGAKAKIIGGVSKTAANGGGGGNVYLSPLTEKDADGNVTKVTGSTMTTEGTITGGKVDGGSADSQSSGGNISVVANGATQSTLTVNGGVIADGEVVYNTKGSAFGGNIRAYNCKVVINDGLIYGGTGGNRAASSVGVLGGTSTTAKTDSTLEINGGVIVGDIQGCTVAHTEGDYAHTCSVKLSGSPKIVTSYTLENGTTVEASYGGLAINAATPVDISGLKTDAEIKVTNSTLGAVITKASDNAVDVVSCFTNSNSACAVAVNDSNQLYIVEAPSAEPEVGVFAPEQFDGMAYCQACIDLGVAEEDALVEWTAYTGQWGDTLLSDSNKTTHYHFYLTGDYTYTTKYLIQTYENICFNLNGYDVTPNTTEKAPTVSCTQRFNLFNTGAEATVLGNAEAGDGTGCVANVNGGGASGTFNLFDNVILKSEATSDNSPILGIGGNGGRINIYGGTIDARDLTVDTYPSAIMLNGSNDSTKTTDGLAVVNMYGGTIYGGTSTGNGGAIRLGSANAETAACTYAGVATFNMYGGTIDGATANGTTGGGIFYIKGNTVNIYGGTVKNGVAPNGHGGNFNLEQTAQTSTSTNVPGVLNISQTDDEVPTLISGGYAGTDKPSTTDEGYVAGNGGTFLVNTGCVLNISGGTIYGGTGVNQGGILRAYLADVNLSGDAELHSGVALHAATEGIWLVDSDLVMSGNAAVYTAAGSTTGGAGVQVAQWRVGSSLTLSGNATVKSVSGESKNSIYVPYSADYPNALMISNDWTGEAYCSILNTSNGGYARGANITEDNANHYVGALANGAVTKGGTYAGKLYYGPQSNAPIIGVDGDLIVALAIAVAADGTQTGYQTNQEAVDAVTGDASAYALLGSNDTVTLSGDAYLDSRGYTITVEGTGTLYALDRANDDYEGYGRWNVAGEVTVADEATNPVNGNRYITIQETRDNETFYSAHRVEMILTHVTLRTDEAGLYYKATFLCDATLASKVTGYGTVLSLNDLPGADFLSADDINIATEHDEGFKPDENHAVNVTSDSVVGILKAERTAVENQQIAEMKIYANLYLMIDAEGDGSSAIYMGDEENAGTTNGTAYSLKDVMVAVDTEWDTYSTEDQATVKAFYTTWKDLGISAWASELENIVA